MKIRIFAKCWVLAATAFFSLAVLPGFGSAATAQLPDKQHFLWYKGHWSPSKKNMFIIEKDTNLETGAVTGSGTVIVDPDGAIHVQSGGVDEWNKKIGAGVQLIDQWTQQLSDPAKNMDPRTHHLSDLLLPDAQEEQQLWQGYTIDPKQDLLSPDNPPSRGSAGNTGEAGANANSGNAGQTKAQTIAEMCTTGKADYDKVIAFYQAHKKYNEADLNVPPPPEFEYNCYACDSNLRKVYDTTITHYVRDFMHPEDSLLRKGLGLERQYQLLGGNARGVIPEEIADAWNKSGACHYFSYGDLNEALLGIMRHLYQRAEKLVMKYRTDFRAVTAIARTYLAVAREYVQMTSSVGVEDPYLQELAGIYAKGFEFYFTKLKQNDWRQIANIPLMLGMCREISLSGGNSGDYDFKNYMDRLLPIMNGFVLNVDMDVKIGRGQGYWLSHVKGQCHIGPDFDWSEDRCYKWVVLDENNSNIDGFYRTKALPQFDCDLVTNEIYAPGASPVYIGSKKFTGTLEGLHMDFCNPGKDTIILTNFSPNPSNNGWWQFPHSFNQNLGITGEQFFSDMNAKKKLVESGKAQEAADKFQAESQQRIDELRAMAAKMQSDTGKKTPTDYRKMMEMVNKIKEAATAPVMAQMLWIDLEIPVKNNDQVLVDKIFNAKEINPQMAPAFEHAFYTVHIENKGNPKKRSASPAVKKN